MVDIVERLRAPRSIFSMGLEDWAEQHGQLLQEAAAEIERLRAQLAEARDAALEEAATSIVRALMRDKLKPDMIAINAHIRALKGPRT